jgi:hypothetical protein
MKMKNVTVILDPVTVSPKDIAAMVDLWEHYALPNIDRKLFGYIPARRAARLKAKGLIQGYEDEGFALTYLGAVVLTTMSDAERTGTTP